MAISKKARVPTKPKKTAANASTEKYKKPSAPPKKPAKKVTAKNGDNPPSSGQVKSVIKPRKLTESPDLISLPPVFTTDSKYLAIASGSHVCVYSILSGEKVHSLEHSSEADIVGLILSKDGSIVSCCSKGVVCYWDALNGKQIKETQLKMDNVAVFQMLPQDKILVAREDEKYRNSFSLYVQSGLVPPVKVLQRVSLGPQCVARGCHNNGSVVIAAISGDGVQVKDMATGKHQKHMTDQRKFTCVALHDKEMVMATGDISGRIIVWHKFIEFSRPIKTVYHWHTLPVNALCFSTEGKFLFSGGNENVLVKWRLDSTNKQCLPRMNSAIRFIVNAPDNASVATSHTDNAIRLVDSARKIASAIVGFVKHEPIINSDSLKESVLPTGLVPDPRTGGFFLNAQAGSLQLFDPHRNSMIFNMDIANRNVLTNERFQVIGNAEVLRAAVSSDGEWLATLESWSNEEANYRDTRLKFWRFNVVASNYELNTDVLMPHGNSAVTSLAFQPGAVGLDWPCLVSIGRTDGKFKVWQLAGEGDNVSSLRRVYWSCQVAGDFRKLTPTAQSFSEDGSLLAIAFESTVTLWDPMTSALNSTLAHSLIDAPIELMEFGRDQCFRYLITVSGCNLCAWDVIAQSVKWMVNQLPGPVSCLVADPSSVFMAVVLDSSEVFVFAPSSSEPVHHEETMGSARVVSAAFVPRSNALTDGPEWLVQSNLLILDERQHFYVLDDEDADTSGSGDGQKRSTAVSHMDSLPWTPIAAMQAQHQVSLAKKLVPVIHDTTGVQGFDSIHSIMETPASALPPMSRLCSAFLRNCLIVHSPKVLQLQQPVATATPMDTTADSSTAETAAAATAKAVVAPEESEAFDRVLKMKYDWLMTT